MTLNLSLDSRTGVPMTLSTMLDAGKVAIVDKDMHTYMVHFSETARHDPVAIRYRGDVFDRRTNARVCPSTGLIEEVPWVQDTFGTLPSPVYATPPGTMLRAFHHQQHWYLSTNRRLDAFSSRRGRQVGAVSFGELFMQLSGVPMGDLNQAGLDKAHTYTFLLVHEDWLPADVIGVYWLKTPHQHRTHLTLPNSLQQIRDLPVIDRETTLTVEPAWGYLWTNGWSWMRITSQRYRAHLDNCNPRERYMQLEMTEQTEALAQYLLARPSIADVKLADDQAWNGTLRRILEERDYRHAVICNRKALKRWDELAAEWQRSQRDPTPTHASRLKTKALTWWHREKAGPHFQLL